MWLFNCNYCSQNKEKGNQKAQYTMSEKYPHPFSALIPRNLCQAAI